MGSTWSELAGKLAGEFAERAAAHDENDSFVGQNFEALKEQKILGMGIPGELGGGGASHGEVCELLRVLATGCPSTSLALSMHQHLVAATVWKFRHGKPGEETLRKVAANQLVLVSTGANDWLDSNGSVERVEGGYKVTATKPFASGSPAGNVLVTSAPFADEKEGEVVLHFPVPLSTEGVSIKQNWRAMGMRGTGSHDVVLEGVFVPDEAIALKRPRGEFHTVWGVVLTVALPLIMSSYRGVADAAVQAALDTVKSDPRRKDDAATHILIGELSNLQTTAAMAVSSMIDLANNYDFMPSAEIASQVLQRKTIAANAAIATVEKAVETIGGSAFLRRKPFERLLRDVHGAQFHPLAEKRQVSFTGRVQLDMPPV